MMTRHEAAAVIGIEFNPIIRGTNYQCSSSHKAEIGGAV